MLNQDTLFRVFGVTAVSSGNMIERLARSNGPRDTPTREPNFNCYVHGQTRVKANRSTSSENAKVIVSMLQYRHQPNSFLP